MKKGEKHDRAPNGQIQNGGRPEAHSVDEVIAGLVRANGIIEVAARHIGCSPRTVRRYMERHEVVRSAQHEIKNKLIDLAEGKLLGKINEGNMTAIIFYLKCQAKDRGYVERTSVIHGGKISTAQGLPDVSDEALAAATSSLIRGEPSEPAKVGGGQGDQ